MFRRGIKKLISERGARKEGRLTGKLRGWNSPLSYQPDSDLFPRTLLQLRASGLKCVSESLSGSTEARKRREEFKKEANKSVHQPVLLLSVEVNFHASGWTMWTARFCSSSPRRVSRRQRGYNPAAGKIKKKKKKVKKHRGERETEKPWS